MQSLANLLLGDLKLGLDDLLDNRAAALGASKAGAIYAPALGARRDALAALPGAVLNGRPLTAELADTDARHDGFGAAVWFYTEAVLRWPDAPAKIAAAARRIRATFVPDLQSLNAAFATEANRAKERKKILAKHKKDLKLFPVTKKTTLYTWVKKYLDAGEELGELLASRADLNAGDRSEVSKLRPNTIALLNRFRAALADEVEHDQALPRDLDAQLFAYFDELARMRASSGASASAQPSAPPAAPTP
jgi:hypothetical protein